MAADDDSSFDPANKFAVIPGAVPGQPGMGERRDRKPHRHLVSVSWQKPAHPMQLGLPGIHESATGIISTSFGHLVEVGITPIIQRWFPTHVVDIRVAPTFVPVANRISDFVHMLEHMGIAYLHRAEICNRFSGDAWHPERFRSRFVHKLRENNPLLEEISCWALSSMVLLISADPQTCGSDREIFAEEIRRISSAVSWHEI